MVQSRLALNKGQTVVFAENFLASASTRKINENYNTFKEYLEEIINSKIPTTLSYKRFKLPWFNRELKRLCRKKSRNIGRRNLLERSIIGSSIKSFKNMYKVN